MTTTTRIKKSTRALLNELPEDVHALVGADDLPMQRVETLIESGINHIGFKSIRAAEPIIYALGTKATWHMLGPIRKSKVKKTVQLFDMIETLDSWRLAKRLDRRGRKKGKIIPVLVKIINQQEAKGSGILLDDLEEFTLRLTILHFIRLEGIMTLGQPNGDPEINRPHFKATFEAYENLSKINRTQATLRYLAMGTSRDYHIAIEEGANLVRVGSKILRG